MPADAFPVLSSSDRPLYPTDGRCPVCGSDFRRGMAYLSAGAILLSKDGRNSLQSGRLRAFLRFGIHGTDPEMADSSDVPVVDDLSGGQFDIQCCSVGCMREWLLRVLEEVESRARRGSRPAAGEPE